MSLRVPTINDSRKSINIEIVKIANSSCGFMIIVKNSYYEIVIVKGWVGVKVVERTANSAKNATTFQRVKCA